MKLNTILLAGAAMIVATGAQAQTIADSINGGASAYGAPWNAHNVGWYYTPQTSFTLSGFSTKFSSTDSRVVTESFYAGTVDTGLTLLGSGTLIPGTDYTAPTFTPVSLTAGTQYFFAFGNVGGLGTNVTADNGAINLPGGLRFDFDTTPSYAYGPETGFTAQPIVRFYSAAGAVPEPATWAMMLVGFGMVGFGLRRRAKQTVRVTYA